MRVWLGALTGAAIAAIVCACGMAGEATPSPPSDADGAVLSTDGQVPDDRDNGPTAPRLVIVNGITETKGAFDGVIVCFGNKGKSKPTTNMPLTNFPGIPVGGGADFGSNISGMLSLEVFDAKTVATAGTDCGSLVNGQPHTTLAVDVLATGVTVVALVTDMNEPKHLGTRQIHYSGDPPTNLGFVQAHFMNLSGVEGLVTLTAGGIQKARLEISSEVSGPFSVKYDSQLELVATTTTGSVTQRLESVQYASDPTSTPDAFFTVRAPFVFALVGDPNVGFDPSAPAKDLTGRELHIIAVPYGDGVP